MTAIDDPIRGTFTFRLEPRETPRLLRLLRTILAQAGQHYTSDDFSVTLHDVTPKFRRQLKAMDCWTDEWTEQDESGFGELDRQN